MTAREERTNAEVTDMLPTQMVGLDFTPTLGVMLGTAIFTGTIIAYGYYNEDAPGGPVYAVMLFMGEGSRIPNERNYVTAMLQMGRLYAVVEHANIVLASECYADDYGMDV